MGTGIRVLLLALLCWCSVQCDRFPRDPEDTLANASGGTLRVGVTEYPPWIQRTDTGYAGVERFIAERFAHSIGARVQWLQGPESLLMHELKNYRLDMVVGGIAATTVWKKEVGLSRPYFRRRVVAVPPGENAFLYRLDHWLGEHRQQIDSFTFRAQQ